MTRIALTKSAVWLALLAVLPAGAQTELSTRGTTTSSIYWGAPRLDSDPFPTVSIEAPPTDNPPLTIENDTLRVTWDGKSLVAVDKRSGKQFLNGSFNISSGIATPVAFSHRTTGRGTGIEIAEPDGTHDRVMLFSNVPFIFFRSVVINRGTESMNVKYVRPFSASLNLGKPASLLKALGSAGLTDVDKNPGSYQWLTIADPVSRNGVVFGWLTSERGSGVFFDKSDGMNVRVGAQIDYGRLPISSGKTNYLETLVVGYFDDARAGLETYADAIARELDIRLPPQPTVFCTWYAPPPYGGPSDAKHLIENVGIAITNLGPYGFSVAQIDDGWQAGLKRTEPASSPRKNFTMANPDGGYPDGMLDTADKLKAMGVTPGLWFMPFAGTATDPWFAEHQDWFVKTASGQPYDTPWGGDSLDMTYDPARAYLSNVVQRITHEWGYQYIKIDGMWMGTATRQLYPNTGYKEDGIGEAIFHDPTASNIEAFRRGMKLVRRTAGPGVFILGCNSPQNMRVYGASMGYLDAMRVGPDNKPQWASMLRGPTFGSRNYFLNGRVWYNDPDPVYVRPMVPYNDARTLCSWVAISGFLDVSSEAYAELPPERMELLKRTMPAHGLLSVRPVDFFENDPPRAWTLQATNRTIIGLFNWDDAGEQFNYSMDRLGLDADVDYYAFDYWQNKLLPPIHGSLQMSIDGHDCRVLSIRPAATHPEVISTSRHVTQGVIDLLDEAWDASTKTLSGRSKLVGGDDYELRIVVPDELTAAEATADAGDAKLQAAEGNLVRVKLATPDSREVSWSVKFR